MTSYGFTAFYGLDPELSPVLEMASVYKRKGLGLSSFAYRMSATSSVWQGCLVAPELQRGSYGGGFFVVGGLCLT